jgi:hypothetical protein
MPILPGGCEQHNHVELRPAFGTGKAHKCATTVPTPRRCSHAPSSRVSCAASTGRLHPIYGGNRAQVDGAAIASLLTAHHIHCARLPGAAAQRTVPAFPTEFDSEFVHFFKNIQIVGGLVVFLTYYQET